MTDKQTPERYGMNMSQADADRVAWVVMAILYVPVALVGLDLLAFALVGGGPIRAIAYGLGLLVLPILERNRIHRHFSPKGR